MKRLSSLKNIAGLVQKAKIENPGKTVRLMFGDEASLGRINRPKYCAGAATSSDPAFPAII